MDNLSKIRPALILKILYTNTDESHTMTIVDIQTKLQEERGMTAYRATIKEDIDLLIAAGFGIEFIKSSQNRYCYVGREFEVAELKVLADAVESSKFITKEKSERLTEKLSTLAGPFSASELKRNVDVERRIKPGNEQIYYIVDAINDAINHNKKISFQYFSYNIQKQQELKHEGYSYIFSPYKLVWNGDYYYVVGFSDKHGKVVNFRVDRISGQPKILDEDAAGKPQGFNIDTYLNSMFRMYNGKREDIELICDNDVIDSIIDRFGIDYEIKENDATTFRIIVNTVASHVFFSWVFGFSGKVRINAPENVKEEYKKMILSTAGNL